MDAAELKAWRAKHGLTKVQAANHLGISRAALANYEEGRRPIPDALAEATRGEVVITPKARKEPRPAAPKIKGASIEDLHQIAAQTMVDHGPRPPGIPRAARRPTAQEIREHPQRFSGPDVWAEFHEPRLKLPGGQEISITIYKGSANGNGGYSLHLVGRCSRRVGDKESLAPGVYRPFRPATGIPLDDGPHGGRRKAA